MAKTLSAKSFGAFNKSAVAETPQRNNSLLNIAKI
jgi:hypothetical protein